MSEILKFFLDFFNPNNETKSSDRFILLIILILSLFILNTIFNFTSQYRFENNLENIKNIEQLNEFNIDNSTRTFLKSQKERIIREENFNEVDLYEVPKTMVLEYLNYRRFKFWHYVTSSWLFIIILIYIPVSLLKRNTILPGTFFLSRIFTIIILLIITYVISLLYAQLLEFIPIISLKYLWINYIINFFSIFFIFGFLWFSYNIFNLRTTEYASINSKKTVPKKPKKEVQFKNKDKDILDLPEGLVKILGEKNPLLWGQEILRYYSTSGGSVQKILFGIFTIVFLLFSFYAYYFTIKHWLS